MARLEELLKGKGYSDADLASLDPLLKDQRFRGVLEGQLGELESAKATAEMQATQWSEWHQKTALPTLDKYMGEAEQARTEAAQVRERLKIAEERGLLKVAQQQEEEKPAKGAPSDGFDPKKYNLVDESRIMQLADMEGDAIAAAQDIAIEYHELFGKPLSYQDDQGNKGMRALRREAVAARVPVDVYIRSKFKFQDRRAEIAAAAAAAREVEIRKDERSKTIAETVNPMLRAPQSSMSPFISRPATVKEGTHPWDNPEGRAQERQSKALQTVLQGAQR
jgi:hypothetical protein